RRLAAARARLDGATWAATWAAGRSLPPGQAVEDALVPVAKAEQGRAMPGDPPPPAHPAGLTAREVEVLRLVAEGLTDAQVAARLALSPRTIGRHLVSVYGKLGVPSRAAATRFALQHGLA